MSRFLSERHRGLTPYDTAGEHEKGYIKLNTNESPFPPSPLALSRAAEAARCLELYPDPDCRALAERAAGLLGLSPEELLVTNGSDEILNFVLMAFCDAGRPAVFPDITYSFYRVLAGVNGLPFREIPLAEDFSLRADDYIGLDAGALFIANPNSPTGAALPLPEVERIVQGSPNSVVVIDEAYVDFGAESCIPLIRKYDNLLVTRTFSKSRSLAGARLGFGVGCLELTRDLRAIKDSVSPYNVSAMTQAAGLGALEDEAYTQANCRAIIENRDFTRAAMRELGFEVRDSLTNFLLVRHPRMGGEALARELRERGVLVRCFGAPRLVPYCRVTIGSREQMRALLDALEEISGESR